MGTIIRNTLFVALLVALNLCFVDAARVAPMRIVNGYESDIGQTQYFIQLRSPLDGGAFCGGALVTPIYVVTAAHCIGTYRDEDVTVVGGSNMKFGNGGVERRIVSVIVHPQFSTHTLDNDVAVIKLDRPMEGKHIKVAQLCKSELQSFEYIEVSGFGLTSTNGPASNTLRSVKLTVMSHEKCRTRHLNTITDAMMCTFVSRKDSCEGDSGGPAIFNKQLCGIVSWGGKCGDSLVPGVYTNVYRVRKFIEQCLRST